MAAPKSLFMREKPYSSCPTLQFSTVSPHSSRYTRTLPHNTNLSIIEHTCHNGRELNGPWEQEQDVPGFCHYLGPDPPRQVFSFFFLLFFLVLGLEPGALGMEGESAAPELHSTYLCFALLICCVSVLLLRQDQTK